MFLNSLEKLELNKILWAVSEFASLDGGREIVRNLQPSADISEVRRRLSLTRECTKLLYTYGIGKIAPFGDVDDALSRSKKGATLSCGEILEICALMRSARTLFDAVKKIDDADIVWVKTFTNKLYFDLGLEEDIGQKIISGDSLSDNASDKLFSIRSRIKSLNDRIREKLAEYTSGKNAEYLQDAIVTLRNDRYVIPVKAEFKSRVRGFVHDRSKTGATFFIEPEYILELNNELIALSIDEKEEVEAILKSLSVRIGGISDVLKSDIAVLNEIDGFFAAAEYGYKLKCTEPAINGDGYINIIKGRHPLIDAGSVVPVSVELGKNYNFLLLSGANTGGKTVTMKMCGLFCLMAQCGLFIPAAEGSSVAAFSDVFCDIGDSQSIEENLSTFSSHISNIVNICNNAKKNSFVLIDELGGGTNPDEGQAIAKAVVKHLLNCGAKGIVTTHFTSLKEFAYVVDGIENASMEFDATTLKPLYSIKIGLPGTSNALAIARRMGMDEKILDEAVSFLSEGARSFENVMRRAETSRVEAEARLTEAEKLRLEYKNKVEEANKAVDDLNREREKIAKGARSEIRRIISERTGRAEELLSEIEDIYKKNNISESDLIAARTLKNKLINSAFEEEGEKNKKITSYAEATGENVKEGIKVFVKPMETVGIVTNFNKSRGEAEILCGSIKMHLKLKDLQIINDEVIPETKFKVVKNIPREQPLLEINVLGMSVGEALYEVDNFIDRALTDNLEEIKVIHGVGTNKLKNAIAEHLKKHKNVESFRLGKYGEGETGVTFIKLK